MSTFGSPQLKDPTAGWEKMIEEVPDWTVFAVNEVAPLVMNRPPGTKMKSKEEDHTRRRSPSDSEKRSFGRCERGKDVICFAPISYTKTPPNSGSTICN